MNAICWEKAIIAGEPSNEHDPYAVTVFENVGGGAAGGSGCNNRLCTVKPKASICSDCQYHERGDGVMEAIPALGQARDKDMRSYLRNHATRTRSVLYRHVTMTQGVSNYLAFFSNLASVVLHRQNKYFSNDT